MSIKPLSFLTLWAGLASAGATSLAAVPMPVAAQAATVKNMDSASAPHDPAMTNAAFSEADPRVTEADRLFREHRVTESLQMLEDILDVQPESYQALLAAARSAIAQGLLAEGSDIQNQWYRIGESTALRATEVVPKGLDGLYWLMTAKGLRAVQSGAADASALGREVYDLAHQILAVDSLHAGAHHALGVLNYEVRKLSRIKRFIARYFLGGGVMGLTSWEDAERYLTRAVELRPNYILFHLDLGSMYLNRGRKEEARSHFERALELPVFEPPDGRFQVMAERHLAETLD